MTPHLKYAYYPGCSLHSTAREYDMSAREVAGELGIELVEIPDWICCGATPAHITMHLLSLALPVKNILQAEKTGIPKDGEITTCCAACFSRLKIANKYMKEDKPHRDRVNEILKESYYGQRQVRHFLDILVNTYGLENLSAKITRRLEGLKAACYYGCLLTRPADAAGFDDMEDPVFMDDLVRALGGETVDWPCKTECCGASFSLTKTDIVLELSGEILSRAEDEGAQVIVTACPMCQSNLDLRQAAINKKLNKSFNIPVVYFTQLVGLCLGIEPGKLGLDKHIVSPERLFKNRDRHYTRDEGRGTRDEEHKAWRQNNGGRTNEK